MLGGSIKLGSVCISASAGKPCTRRAARTLGGFYMDQPPTTATGTDRLFFMDHLRAALVTLVVVHHVASVYGAGAPFYYVEPPFTDPLAYVTLLAFILINQAWFMGALFFVSGYFVPGSFDRQGPAGFIKGRLLRLGVPLLVFYFVLAPLTSLGFYHMPPSLTGITEPFSFKAYPYLIDMGPMWFAALLLIFDFLYAGRRALVKKDSGATPDKSSLPGYISIVLFIVALAVVSWLFRMVIPMGKKVIGFPTLAYLPQYASFFVLGIVASRGNRLRSLPSSKGWAGIVAAVVATAMLLPLAVSGKMFSLEFSRTAEFLGNGTWQSAVYALWDSIISVSLCLALVPLFRSFWNGTSRFGRFVSGQSYAVYILHCLVIVLLAVYVFKGIDIAALPKFALVAVVAVPVCFVAAWLVRKIPGVAKVV